MDSIRSKLVIAARLVLGLIFAVFGLNGFLQFMPPPPVEGAALAYLGGLASASYFFPLLKGTEILVGLALLTGRFVPLALVVLAPITVQIAAFHLALAPDGLAMTALIVALHIVLAWAYRASYRELLVSREPASSAPSSSTQERLATSH